MDKHISECRKSEQEEVRSSEKKVTSIYFLHMYNKLGKFTMDHLKLTSKPLCFEINVSHGNNLLCAGEISI